MGEDPGIVAVDLGPDGKPVYAHGGDSTRTVTNQASFDQWYRDVEGINQRFERPFVLTQLVPGTFVFEDDEFYPIDGEGFVTIKGRAKRFAKLGGEMVSLAAVEALAVGLWPDAVSAAAAVPDPRKGEQLLLVTDKPQASKDDLLAHARREGFPELWVPKAILIVQAVPVLASGKVDLQATVELARQSTAAH